MEISERDHEAWYGDTKVAAKMEKEQLEKKLHTKLTFLNMRSCKLRGFKFNFKEILK